MNAVTIPSSNANINCIGDDHASANIIETLNLTKTFSNFGVRSLLGFRDNGKARVAVDSLSLTVPRGAVYGYLGPNGAGKTTTIKMLVGLLRPTKGTASICGHTIHDDLRSAQQHLGYMPDAVHRLPAEKPVEFLQTLGELSGLRKDDARGRALDMLSWADLDDESTLNTKVNKWSAGTQRKLLFIQAMLHKPNVLILDEPTASLDPIARRELVELLKQATKGTSPKDWRTTVLISSHDLPEVQEISTEIGFLNHGELIAEGTKEDLRDIINKATGGAAAAFTLSGINLTEIANEIRDKLGARVVDAADTKLTLATKRESTLFKDLAGIAENHPDVTITNMAQEKESLESVFLNLARTQRKPRRETEEETKE